MNKLPPPLRRSVRQERAIARDTGGRRQAASGSLPGLKGDVKTKSWLIEAKTTAGVTYTLKLRTWRKIEQEALVARKEPVLVLEISGRKLAIIDYDLWVDMLASN